jgi:hypothetical protein
MHDYLIHGNSLLLSANSLIGYDFPSIKGIKVPPTKKAISSPTAAAIIASLVAITEPTNAPFPK